MTDVPFNNLSKQPSNKLASAILDVAERDKGLTHACLVDLIEDYMPSTDDVHEDGYVEGYEHGYAKALEEALKGARPSFTVERKE